MGKNILGRIISAWLIVGTLDIGAAFIEFFIISHTNPLDVLPGIASGIFGLAAFSGDAVMKVWGLVFHYLIALCFTLFFFWISSTIPAVTRKRALTGCFYGIFIWIVMRLIVLPLSNLPLGHFHPVLELIAAAILIVCIGLPLAFLVPGPKPEE